MLVLPSLARVVDLNKSKVHIKFGEQNHYSKEFAIQTTKEPA
jgi:hypothetical protein